MNVSLVNTSLEDCGSQLRRLTTLVEENLGSVLLTAHVALCCVSSVVSLLNIAILTRPAMSICSLNTLLCLLEISNLFVALCFLPPTTVLRYFPHALLHTQCVYLLVFFLSVAWGSVHFSSCLAPLVGAWRLVAVKWPFSAKTQLTKFRAMAVAGLLGVGCFTTSTTLNVMAVRGFYGRRQLCREGDFEPKGGFVFNWDEKVYNFAGYYVTGVYVTLPSVTFLGITACLIWSLASFRKNHLLTVTNATLDKKRNRTTAVLIVILSCFVVANVSPYVTFFQINLNLPGVKYPVRYAFDQFVFGLVTNSLSFVGYYNMSSHFRDSFWKMFGRKTLPSRVNTVLSRVDSN